MKLKQKKIKDYFDQKASHDAREQFYQQWDQFRVCTEVSKPVPTTENVRKRLGRRHASEYQTLLARAEDAGVVYMVSSNQNMNTRTIMARIRAISAILDTLLY